MAFSPYFRSVLIEVCSSHTQSDEAAEKKARTDAFRFVDAVPYTAAYDSRDQPDDQRFFPGPFHRFCFYTVDSWNGLLQTNIRF